jgi:hypothetical protein
MCCSCERMETEGFCVVVLMPLLGCSIICQPNRSSWMMRIEERVALAPEYETREPQ